MEKFRTVKKGKSKSKHGFMAHFSKLHGGTKVLKRRRSQSRKRLSK